MSLVNLGLASPGSLIPQSTEFPDSAYTPTVRQEKVFHGMSGLTHSTSSPLCRSLAIERQEPPKRICKTFADQTQIEAISCPAFMKLGAAYLNPIKKLSQVFLEAWLCEAFRKTFSQPNYVAPYRLERSQKLKVQENLEIKPQPKISNCPVGD